MKYHNCAGAESRLRNNIPRNLKICYTSPSEHLAIFFNDHNEDFLSLTKLFHEVFLSRIHKQCSPYVQSRKMFSSFCSLLRTYPHSA